MRRSSWSPSVVPSDDETVYLVADDFGKIGRCWRETDMENTDLETVLNDLLTGEYKNLVNVVGFNTAEGWSRDVSEELPTRSGGAATCRLRRCRRTCRSSWSDMNGPPTGDSFGWSEPVA